MEEGATAATPPTRGFFLATANRRAGTNGWTPGLWLARSSTPLPFAIAPTAGGLDRWQPSAGGLTAGGSGSTRHASVHAHDRSAQRVLSLSLVVAAVLSKWASRHPTLAATWGLCPPAQSARAYRSGAGHDRVSATAERSATLFPAAATARRAAAALAAAVKKNSRQRGGAAAADRLVVDSGGVHDHHPRCGGSGGRVWWGGRWPCPPPAPAPRPLPPPPRGRRRRGRRAAPPPQRPPPPMPDGWCERGGWPPRLDSGGWAATVGGPLPRPGRWPSASLPPAPGGTVGMRRWWRWEGGTSGSTAPPEPAPLQTVETEPGLDESHLRVGLDRTFAPIKYPYTYR